MPGRVPTGRAALTGSGQGLLIGLLQAPGQRDFSSVSGMRADRYEVMADQEVADEAADLLARMPRR